MCASQLWQRPIYHGDLNMCNLAYSFPSCWCGNLNHTLTFCLFLCSLFVMNELYINLSQLVSFLFYGGLLLKSRCIKSSKLKWNLRYLYLARTCKLCVFFMSWNMSFYVSGIFIFKFTFKCVSREFWTWIVLIPYLNFYYCTKILKLRLKFRYLYFKTCGPSSRFVYLLESFCWCIAFVNHCLRVKHLMGNQPNLGSFFFLWDDGFLL